MSSRYKQLIIEIFLLREKYSAEEIDRACEQMRSKNLDKDLSILLELLNSQINPRHSKIISKNQASKPNNISKDEIIRRLKNSSQSIRYHMITELSGKLGLNIKNDQRPTLEEIIDKIRSLNGKEYSKIFSTKSGDKLQNANQEPDGDYLGLANFIMGVNRKIEQEK